MDKTLKEGMLNNSGNYHRKTTRLKGYDYSSPGEYFVTICTYQRECLFGNILREEIQLNPLGLIVQEEWLNTRIIRPEIELDAYIIMPNHLHGIIVIKDESEIQKQSFVRTHGRASRQGVIPQNASLRRQPRSLGAIIAGFKSAATKRINEKRNALGTPVWQSRFYEHIIRSERDLDNIREYIINNPVKWHEDGENPINDDQNRSVQ